MIEFKTGNILKSNTQALVNTVNLEGFMGKGIAYQFKNEFPNNNEAYKVACKNKQIDIGKIYVFQEKGKFIFNFPTKNEWRKDSKYEYIEKGMKSLLANIEYYQINSISIPPLGCGNGGLEWNKVKEIILDNIDRLSNNIKIILFEPSKYYKSKTKQAPKMNASHILLMILKTKMIKFNKLRLQKAAFLTNLYSNNDYFKFNEYKFGPYSHSIEILSREIKEYQEYYSMQTDEAIDQLYNRIVSKNVDEKIERYSKAIEEAACFVNKIERAIDLEIITTLLWIIKEHPNYSSENIIEAFFEWPKEKMHRFKRDEINDQIKNLLENNIITKSLLGYEIELLHQQHC